MPIFDMKNNSTGEVQEFFISNSKKEEMISSGEWEQVHTSTPDLITHHGYILGKTSGDWKNKIEQIKKGSGRSNSIHT